MCALYLHHALFSPEPSPLPTHSRQTSSFSAFTIRTSTSDSHPTEPLLTPSYGESSAYLDLLSRQPQHPDSPRRIDALDLASEPPSERERRSKWESRIRKRIQRLRWMRRVLSAVIGECCYCCVQNYFIRELLGAELKLKREAASRTSFVLRRLLSTPICRNNGLTSAIVE